VEASLF